MLDRTKAATITSLVMVTPGMAQHWLRSNSKNRAKSQSVVAEYARAMKENRWRLNGETIKIGTEGALIDGQHRLQACVDSGCTFETLVVTGVDEDTFDTIDTGKKRTAGDVIGIEGCRNANSTAAAVRWITTIRAGAWHLSAKTMTADEIRLFVAAEPQVEESTAKAKVARAIMAPGLCGALHFLFWQKDPDAADKFFSDLGRGTDLAAGDPVLLLREKLIKDRLTKTRLKNTEICVVAIRAWARRRAETPSKGALKGTITGTDGKRQYPDII